MIQEGQGEDEFFQLRVNLAQPQGCLWAQPFPHLAEDTDPLGEQGRSSRKIPKQEAWGPTVGVTDLKGNRLHQAALVRCTK